VREVPAPTRTAKGATSSGSDGVNRTGFIGGHILREDVSDAKNEQVFPGAA
jgi:hypothetical protein